MTDNVEVKLGADTSAATSNMGSAADAIAKSLQEITRALENFGKTEQKIENQVVEQNRSMAQSFKELHEQAKAGIEKINSTFESFQKGLLVIGAVLAGGHMFKEAVGGIIEEAAEVKKLQSVFGMAAEEATTLNVALKLVGKSSEEYADMAMKLQRQIKANGDNVRAMGLEFNDAAGNLRPLNETTKDALALLQEYQVGADRNAAAMYLFGRSASEVYGFFKLNEATMQRAIELQHAYGIEMGPETQAQVKAYKQEQAALHIMFEQVHNKVGEALLPVLTQLAGWFNESGPAAVQVFSNVLRGVITVIQEVVMIFKMAVTGITVFFDNLITDISAAGSILKSFIEANYSAIPKIIEQRNEAIRRNNQVAGEQVVEIWQKTTDQVGKLWSDVGHGAGVDTPEPKGGSRKFVDPGKGGKDESIMSKLEAELGARRDAFERMKLDQGSFEQFSHASESAYWKSILDTVELSEKDRQEVLKKYYEVERKIRIDAFQREIADLQAQAAAFHNNIEARIGIAEQEHKLVAQRYGNDSKEAQIAYAKIVSERRAMSEQLRKVNDIEEKEYQQHLLHELDMDKLAIDQSLALGQINQQQSLAADANLENKRTEILRKGLEDRLALAVQDPDRNPELIASLNAQIENLEDQHQTKLTQLRDQAAKESAKFQIEAIDSAKSSFSTFLQDMGKGTMSIKDAFNKMATSIVDDLQKIASKQLMEQMFGGGGAGGGGGGGGAGMLGSIMGMIFGGGGGVPAFAQGTPYVPKTQLAVVHEGEAIVPKQYNNGGGANNISINVAGAQGGMDYSTQQQLAMRIGGEVNRAMKRNS